MLYYPHTSRQTHSMNILGKLFGSTAQVKIMRLFLLNPDTAFENKDISNRSRIQGTSVRKELAMLASIGFIKKKSFIKETLSSRNKVLKRRTQGWILNNTFRFIAPLRTFLIDAEFLKKEDIASKFKIAGKIKLLVVSGVFIQQPSGRIDILVVGDNLKRGLIEKTVRLLESEIGKELSYAVFDTKEFIYRTQMYDKLVWDVFDFPHERILDNKEFSTLLLKKVE